MSQIDISIIVPIYQGKDYIPFMIEQIERCKYQLKANQQVELLLINDCPEEYIDDYKSSDVYIKVFNTDTNCGIQGARVKGVKLSRGKYVLMLDQDDKIRDIYLRSQLENIEKNKADATVCRALHENKPVYNSQNCFEQVISLKYMLEVGNSIISPGQVLIRKSSLPSVWINNLLYNNGSDDWLLWLSMLAEKKKFVLNKSCLYEHVINGRNTSQNTNRMLDSGREVVKILKKQAIFSNEQLQILEGTMNASIRRQINASDKYKKIFYIYDRWMNMESDGWSLNVQLCEKGYRSVAIYGLSPIGRLLIKKLKSSDIIVKYVIDREADYYKSDDAKIDIAICKMEEIYKQKDVDAILVTIIEQEQMIVQALQKMVKIPVLCIKDILFGGLNN